MATARIGKLERQIKELQEGQAEAQQQAKEAVIREQCAARMNEKAQQQAKQASAKATELQVKVGELQEQLQEQRESRDKAVEDARQAQEELQASRAELWQSSARAERLSVQLTETRRDLEARRAEADSAEAAARAEAEEARRAAAEMEAKLDVQAGRVRALEVEVLAAKAEAEEARRGAQAKWANKLAQQLKELQEELDDAAKKKRAASAELQREREDHAQRRRELRKAADALQEERNRVRKLESELGMSPGQRQASRMQRSRSVAGSFGGAGGDDATIEALAGILQRDLQRVPVDQRQSIRKQMLLCFHPDRNPAKEVATRITQILNGAE
mmetsp:Transcript_174/g.382  ORF Transcript_174/g.382 Transcript_174/m.382 type:complete len:331 (-) Transcript_174:98-1090(-)